MKTTRRGFSLIETCIAVTLVSLGSLLVVVEGRQMMDNSRARTAVASCSSLNFAMGEYRTYYSDGYRPDAVWSAENAAGVVAELRKPLRRGSKTVVALNDHELDLVAILDRVAPRTPGNTADDFSMDCVWFVKTN